MSPYGPGTFYHVWSAPYAVTGEVGGEWRTVVRQSCNRCGTVQDPSTGRVVTRGSAEDRCFRTEPPENWDPKDWSERVEWLKTVANTEKG